MPEPETLELIYRNALYWVGEAAFPASQAGDRWLTLIDAPAWLTRSWLRDAGLKRDVILLLKTRSAATAVELACEALQRGRSHTVISWLQALDAHSRQMLTLMALQGQSQSLNIRLG